METMERDAEYIAGQVKFIRRMYGLTQENLADAAGLTTRTIEKAESGRHRPSEQTLRSIARAVQMDGISFFDKPSPEQQAAFYSQLERARCKTAVVRTIPIIAPNDFLGVFGNWQASQTDTSAVEGDEAMDLAASLTDWIRDLGDVWVDLPRTQQLESARSIADLCSQLEACGYVCYIGTYHCQLKQKEQPPIVFKVGVTTLLPKDDHGKGERLALVELEGGWETMEKDRFPIPSDKSS